MNASGMKGLGLMVVAIVLLAGVSGVMFYNDGQKDDIIPRAEYVFELSYGVVAQHDSAEYDPSYDVIGNYAIDVMTRQGKTLNAVVSLNVTASSEKGVASIDERYDWTFNLDMSDKGIEVYDTMEIDIGGGVMKNCSIYVEELTGGNVVAFYVNLDDKMVYRVDYSIDCFSYQGDIITEHIDIYATFVLTESTVRKGVYSPELGVGERYTADLTGMKYTWTQTSETEITFSGKMYADVGARSIGLDGVGVIAYNLNSNVTASDGSTITYTDTIYVTDDGKLIFGELLTSGADENVWYLQKKSDTYANGVLNCYSLEYEAVIGDNGELISIESYLVNTYSIVVLGITTTFAVEKYFINCTF